MGGRADAADSPAVSVIIPARDAERTIGAQLEALGAQVAAPAFEVIVCDNGSVDRTAEVARSFAGSLAHLAVVDASARRGPSAARNLGAAAARGTLLAFCDADDVASPTWLARLASALGDADAVAGGFEHALLNDPRGASVSWSTDVPIVLDVLPELSAGASSNLAVRAAAFTALGGFDESLATCEDIDLCWRLQRSGRALVFAPDALVHERKRRGVRATYRQAVAYARGTRALEAKHRDLITARRGANDADSPASTPGPTSSGTSTARRSIGDAGRALASRLRRRDRCSVVADAAWRLGQRRGRRVDT